jgi:peptidoglycan hydrolase-like protein with peptidoglycan-binding domain
MHILKNFNIAVMGAVITVAIIFLPGGTAFANTDPNAGVAGAVQAYFSDIPVMIAIAKCESGPRQFESDGTPLLGGTGTMVGVFQLDETIHTNKALALGFDITTLAGNMSYARYLYGVEGTEPWISSFPCWSSSLTSTTVMTSPASTTIATAATTTIATGTSGTATTTAIMATSTPALTLDLSLGSIDPQVMVLQQMLNADGFTVAASGPGSPGNETTKFGALTYAALKKFQCAKGIACSGEEATTGYGFLNAATRTALLAAAAGGANTTMATSTVASTTAPAVSNDNPAEIAELESRLSALIAIVAQLKAEIAARQL